MSKPKICEVLGVEVMQPWRLRLKGVEKKSIYRITPDGDIEVHICRCRWEHLENIDRLTYALNHSEDIVHLPHWLDDDIADAKAVVRLYPEADWIVKTDQGVSVHCSSYDRIGYVYDIFINNKKSFESAALNVRYALQEILDAEEIGDGIACPRCACEVDECDSYCWHCGQKLDWEGFDDE